MDSPYKAGVRAQVMRRNEQQGAMDSFNKRIGRPGAASQYVRAAAPMPAPVQAAATPSYSTPQAAPASRPPQPLPASAAPAAAAASPMPSPYSDVGSVQRPPVLQSVSTKGQALPPSSSQEFVSRFR